MSKMIAVLDNINNCFDCPVCIKITGIGWKCNMTKIYMGELDLTKRPHFCPLREVPEKLEGDNSIRYQWGDYEDGWNNCLNEIVGD